MCGFCKSTLSHIFHKGKFLLERLVGEGYLDGGEREDNPGASRIGQEFVRVQYRAEDHPHDHEAYVSHPAVNAKNSCRKHKLLQIFPKVAYVRV